MNKRRLYFSFLSGALTLFCSIHVSAQEAQVFTTCADGSQQLSFSRIKTGTSYGTNIIRLQPREEYQPMDGFGYALTYSSCFNLMQMTRHERTELLRRTFSPQTGFGVSYTRISIGCSDFSSKVYTLCDSKGLEHFNLTADETNYVIPILKEVLEINPELKIIASPWTCPKWMKVKDIVTKEPYDSWTGGKLNPSYYAEYAQYFVKFIEAFRKEGIPIYAITPQNEPLHSGNCASLYMPWQEEAAFIAHLAPAFKQAGIKTKIYCFDHNYNYDDKPEQEDYPVKVFNALSQQMEGSELVVGSAWHDYGGTAEELDDINQKAPDKEVVFTESSIGTWNDGRNLSARLIPDTKNLVMSTVNRQCRAVVVWNMMLDLKRGPNLDGGCTTCYGALDIDSEGYHKVTPNSHYFVMAHASIAASPGAIRIGTKGSNISQVSHVAFKNRDGSFGLVIINEGSGSKTISILENTKDIARVKIPAKSVVSVRMGMPSEQPPTFGEQEMTESTRGKFSLKTTLKQHGIYSTTLHIDDGWYIDPDFFSITEDGKMEWMPLDGTYQIEADIQARTLTAHPIDKPLDTDGQGIVFLNGPRRSIGKPCFFLDDEWMPTQALPMAEIEDGLYRLTVTVGEQLNPDCTDFALYTSPQMDTPFSTTENAPFRITLNEDDSDHFFALGKGKDGHKDGHVYQRYFFFKLKTGDQYTITLDLRQGTNNGTLCIRKVGEGGASICPTPADRDKQISFDLQGRHLPNNGAKRGIVIQRGKKTLMK